MREVPALLAQLADLNVRIEDARRKEVDAAIATCRELIETFELSAYDVGLVPTQVIPMPRHITRTFGPARVRDPALPKYRDPATGETWSGRGRPPSWILEQDRDELLIR
ncbi:H-NS histone family protein [Paraburkholderia adhaesiva]|uniref:H-NS histone family protein n=1 Tax=Paraburkholderia adhaesiva TaxID=2883244 RepID=UPI001F1A32E9|nr:H-NS histone family protein [Paraburkholderia adhaesiva]